MRDGAWDSGGARGATAPGRDRSLTGTKILVVEDSPSARKLMQELLLRLGVTLPDLRLSSTVVEALQLFAQWKPDIVFVDLQLRPPPDLTAAQIAAQPSVPNAPKNGAELAVQLLAREPSLKVVVCSASETDGTAVADLVRQGKVKAIVKPVLAAKVQEVLAAFASPPEPAGRRR